MFRRKPAPACLLAALVLVLISPGSGAEERTAPADNNAAVGGARQIEPSEPQAAVHATVESMERFRETHPRVPHGSTHAATTVKQLSYHGGLAGAGVETAPKIYLVFWGSQWINGDPNGEAALLEAFYNGVGGSAWTNSVTQYCQGVSRGTTLCAASGTGAGNPANLLAGYWYDNTGTAPAHPKQSQLAAEAARAAAHFGNATAASNLNVQYVVATAHGHSSSGFGTQYLRVAQLLVVVLWHARVHEPSVHHGCRRKLRSEFQRPRLQRRRHDCRRARNGGKHHRSVPGHWLARCERRRERRQVRVDRVRARRGGSDHD